MPRTQSDDFWSDAGAVLDCSPRGARLLVASEWQEGTAGRLKLRVYGETFTVNAICVWSHGRSDGHGVVGLAFFDMDFQTRDRLYLLLGDGITVGSERQPNHAWAA